MPIHRGSKLRGYYCLESDYSNQDVNRGQDGEIIVVDPELSEKSSTSGPGQVGDTGPEYGTEDADEDGKFEGLSLYTFQDSDPAGTWRGVFTAADNGGVRSPAWRTHDALRMLTANSGTDTRYGLVYEGLHLGDEGAEPRQVTQVQVQALQAADYILNEDRKASYATDGADDFVELWVGLGDWYHGRSQADRQAYAFEFNGHCGPSYWRTRSLSCANTGWNWCSSVGLPDPSYKCGHCDYVYDPTVADPDRGYDPITNFDELDVGWKCPDCQGAKQDFTEHEDPYTGMRGHTIVLDDHQYDGHIWQNATWAHFLTCWVGAADGLAEYVADNGIAAAMGYEKRIAIGSCYAEWTQHFHDQAKTKTLYQAAADTLDWWRQGTDHYWPNDPRYDDDYGGYTSKRFYGDPSTRLQLDHNQYGGG